MPAAEIITIGTEILLGEIIDTNARFLARCLRENGIDLYRKTTIGDNAQRISQVICEALGRSDIVITTGGLGPTVDDPTREAVALAMNVETEFRPELWEQIQARFIRYNRQPTENNRRQAYIPHGALAIENPVGTAPSFIVEDGEKCIISLPGVPSEMQFLTEQSVLPYIRRRYRVSTVIKTRTLHTAGVGESQIDHLIGDLEKLSNPTVGLAAHSGQVDVRIVAKAETELVADSMIGEIEAQLRERLGRWIYGIDTETLEAIAIAALQSRGWTLVVVEAGSLGELVRRLASLGSPVFRGAEILANLPSIDELTTETDRYRRAHQAEVGLGVTIKPGLERQEVAIVLLSPDGQQQVQRPYGGPPEYAPRWAAHHSLDMLRQFQEDGR